MGVIENSIAIMERRLQELRPAVREAEELERLLAAAKTPRGRGANNSKRPYIPLSLRKQQVMEIVRSEPGIQIKDIAAQIGVTGPRVTQIVNALEADGTIKRGNDGLSPTRNHRSDGRSSRRPTRRPA